MHLTGHYLSGQLFRSLIKYAPTTPPNKSYHVSMITMQIKGEPQKQEFQRRAINRIQYVLTLFLFAMVSSQQNSSCYLI